METKNDNPVLENKDQTENTSLVPNIKQNQNFSNFNIFFNRTALSIQLSALMVNSLDTILPAEWLNNHSCLQPDGSKNFAKDIPKIVFLSSLPAYGLIDFCLSKKIAPASMVKMRLLVRSAMSTLANGIFLENLKENVGFNSTETIRLFQGLMAVNLILEIAFAIKKPAKKILNIPEIAAPKNTLQLTVQSIKSGATGYTFAYTFVDMFYLAFLAKDPANLQTALNAIFVIMAILGGVSKFNDKANYAVENVILPIASNMNLLPIAIISTLLCVTSLDPSQPLEWLFTAMVVTGLSMIFNGFKAKSDIMMDEDQSNTEIEREAPVLNLATSIN